MTVVEDLRVANQYFLPIESRAFLGDGRSLNFSHQPSSDIGDFDLIFYSPPYLNNIDYTEVYKLELWLCGFINNYEEFRSQRYKTLRSHPSVRFPDPIKIDADKEMSNVLSVMDILVKALPKDKNLKWRTDLFRGYFDDIYQSLKQQINVLRPGGWIFCTVGNSLHGPRDNRDARVPVAADLIIALIAKTLGLDVKAIEVARFLTRRTPNRGFMRESVIVMRKQ
jgi:DNA modification methylase